MTTILLVRHGETRWNREGRMHGWAPVPLSDLGREQADRLGTVLRREYDVDRVRSSDLHRARETTELVRDHVDAPVTFDPAWRERDFGEFQGLLASDWLDRFPEYDLGENGPDAAAETPDSGESLLDARDRVLDAWETLLAECEPTETLLVVGHGTPIRLVLGRLAGLDVAAAIDRPQSNCALNEVRYDAETDEATIVRENDGVPTE